jgi:hypothetical protein
MIDEWKSICEAKSWYEDKRYVPRIVELVELFEKKFPETTTREHTACLAVVMYLFGPIEDEEEVELYLGIVKRRLRDHRNQAIQ